MPTSKVTSKQRLPARSNGSRRWARITAGSRSEPTRSPVLSTGSARSAPIRVHAVSPNSSPSAWSKAASREETRLRPNDDLTSPRVRSRPKPSAGAVRSHWAIENNLHWTLDMTFQEDQSRLRAGHGAKNMAVVRHFALNLVRKAGDKRSIKRRRKRASWDPQYLLQILQPLQ